MLTTLFQRTGIRWTSWLWLLITLIAVSVAGCTTGTPPAVAAPSDDETVAMISADILRPGDRIRIVYNDIPDPPTPVEQVIPEDGKILLTRGLEITVTGKKRTDVEREITELYAGIYRHLTVTIERRESFVSVGGEVRNNTSIVYRGDLTVLAAIDAAGGFTEYADQSDVLVTRGATKQQIRVNAKRAIRDPRLNLRLYPGDSIRVHRSIF
ncbi:MAG: SLBB domain-containing protein [Verrucomicrobiae bacterium]|nr:SLBB domain-containing protein [Verrucomicrobiae bacterium]